jgi:hypothetical protein
MMIKSVKVFNSRNYINSNIKLAHLVWNHYNQDNPVIKGVVVHHKDEDKLNDHISNLELMTKSNHRKLHATGKKFSKETRDKISESNRRRKLSELTKQKISIANKGKSHPQTEETKIKISIANSGKIFSSEHKKKLSDSAKTRVGEKNPNYGKKKIKET